VEGEQIRDGGIYYLIVELSDEMEIEVGALGWRHFPAGYYVYAGSAQRGLGTRLARHRRKKKPLRWHIDYLTTRGEVVEACAFALGKEKECRASRQVGRLRGARLWVKGFGASDCGCSGHLYYFGSRPKLPESLDSIAATDIIPRGGDQCRKPARRGRGIRQRGNTSDSTNCSRPKKKSS
jgi:sugar fermentation stimulation protein A